MTSIQLLLAALLSMACGLSQAAVFWATGGSGAPGSSVTTTLHGTFAPGDPEADTFSLTITLSDATLTYDGMSFGTLTSDWEDQFGVPPETGPGFFKGTISAGTTIPADPVSGPFSGSLLNVSFLLPDTPITSDIVIDVVFACFAGTAGGTCADYGYDFGEARTSITILAAPVNGVPTPATLPLFGMALCSLLVVAAGKSVRRAR